MKKTFFLKMIEIPICCITQKWNFVPERFGKSNEIIGTNVPLIACLPSTGNDKIAK